MFFLYHERDIPLVLFQPTQDRVIQQEWLSAGFTYIHSFNNSPFLLAYLCGYASLPTAPWKNRQHLGRSRRCSDHQKKQRLVMYPSIGSSIACWLAVDASNEWLTAFAPPPPFGTEVGEVQIQNRVVVLAITQFWVVIHLISPFSLFFLFYVVIFRIFSSFCTFLALLLLLLLLLLQKQSCPSSPQHLDRSTYLPNRH